MPLVLVPPQWPRRAFRSFASHDAWSAKLEFDHIDYAARPLGFTQNSDGVISSFNQSQSASANLVMAGVNYQFGWSNIISAKRSWIASSLLLLAMTALAGSSPRNYASHGHFTSGGIEDRIDSTLPPVFKPKMVPRS